MVHTKPEGHEPDGQPLQAIKYPCPVCKGQKFKSEQGFSDHLRWVHKIFSCPKCDAIYASADDLARHKTEARHRAEYNNKRKPRHRPFNQRDKVRPASRIASSPAITNSSSAQVPVRLRPPPARPRRSTAQARQPATETRKLPAQIRQSPKQVRQSTMQGHQPAEQFRQQRGHVFQPRAQAFQPGNQVYQPPVGLPQGPTEAYQAPTQGFQVPAQAFQPPAQGFQTPIQGFLPPVEVPQFPMGFHQAPTQAFEPPSRLVKLPVDVCEAAVRQAAYQSYQRPTPVYQTPQIHNAPPWGYQNQVDVYQGASPVRQTPPPVYQIPAQIYQIPARRNKNQVQAYQPPVQVSQFPEYSQSPKYGSQSLQQGYQSPVQRSQHAKKPFQQPEQVFQPPVQGSQSLKHSHPLQISKQVEDVSQSLENPQFSEQDSQHAEQASQYLSHGSKSPEQGSRSLEHSRFTSQGSQNAEKVTQSPAQHCQQVEDVSQSRLLISEQTEQASQSSMHLSAQDGTAAEANDSDGATPDTPETNTTTPSLFNPPTTINPTFSLVYKQVKHRWTDLEPLEQTLILRYLLGRCHSQPRLHCQGYNAPKTIDTTACLRRGEPHKAHDFNRCSTRRKAIVIDCEMIETTVCTSELAYITAIDFLSGEVLINSYVAPTAPVTNWLTPVSGMTPEGMDAAITEGKAFQSNSDARRALRKFLDHDTVLIGHALHHDLRTLSLIHGRIVDTSLLTAEAAFPNLASRTTFPRVWGLKALAKEMLGIEIQASRSGHNSLEDALATREILIWCLRGPECLKAWAEKARSSYEHMRQQRGVQMKAARNAGKKAGVTVAAPSGKVQGKKRGTN